MIPLKSLHKRLGALVCLALFSTLAWCATPAQIQDMLDQGNNQQALAASESYVAATPDDVDGNFLRGVAQARLGQNAAAIQTFAELARAHPEVPEYANNLAVLYARQGEYEKARRWLEAAMSTHPAYATAHRNLGDVYTALAAVAYSKALDQQGQSADLGVQLELVSKLYDAPAGTQVAQAPSESESTPRVVEAPAPQPEPARPPQAQAEPTPAPTPAPQPAPEPVTEPEPAPEVAVQPQPEPAAVPAQPGASAATARLSTATQQDILQAVLAWAQAWSNQNVDAYLNAYADNFYPGDDLNLAQWREQRRDRVSSPGSIRVEVSEPEVELDEDGNARVTFRQAYDADNYSDRVKKTLVLERKAGSWRIVREISNPL